MSDAARSDQELPGPDAAMGASAPDRGNDDGAKAGQSIPGEGSGLDVAPTPRLSLEPESAGAEERAQGRLIPFLAPTVRQNPSADEILSRFAARQRAQAKSESGRGPRDWRRLRAAASLAAVVAVGAAAAAEHVHVLRVAQADQTQTLSVASRLDALSARLESADLSRSRDELTNLRKLLTEIKSGAASTRDVGGAIGQLAGRVDRLEKDQSARLDKLAERLDHDAAARLSDVVARLDRLETKAVATAPAKTAPPLKTVVAKAAAEVSEEPTGALDRPPARLRKFALGGVRNGFAMIYSPAGEFVVAPGDFVPGGGRVLRFERHGRDWAVVTTEGQIVASDE